jgi:glutamate-5-semialdehyde dehydrogenase
MTKEKLFNCLKKMKESQPRLAFSSFSQRNKILEFLQENLRENLEKIIKENQKDLRKMKPSDPKYDRLLLNEKRILSMIESINEIRKLDDPWEKF